MSNTYQDTHCAKNENDEVLCDGATMMQQLIPSIVSDRQSLKGLYLARNLHQQADLGDVHIYANYISSVDGRISLRDAISGEFFVPKSIANARDWRLYQELAAQCDVMITSARYFRQLAQGNAQDLLPVGRETAYRDLMDWRVEQGLKAQPDVVIVSRSLDIPISTIETFKDRRVMVVTTEESDDQRRQKLMDAGVQVFNAGGKTVDGAKLKQLLIQQAYRSAYMIAGPEVFRMLLTASVLDRLFLTTRLCLLGGREFHTVLQHDLPKPIDLQLNRLYFDAQGQQHFADYQVVKGSR